MICNAELCPNYFSVNVFVLAVVFRRQFSKNDNFALIPLRPTFSLMEHECQESLIEGKIHIQQNSKKDLKYL